MESDNPATISMEMVFIEGGTFKMGSNDGEDREKPIHTVTVSDFYMGKYEVTQSQWKAIMDNNPSCFKNDNLPVEQVSWDEVHKFISKLNSKTGKTYRLPTEAEWEYAARGGNKSQGCTYAGSNTLDDVAWCWNNRKLTTHPVGSKQPNELGLYDMTGNVLEWCNDWYNKYSSNTQINPTGPSSGSCRVFRGGSWINFAQFCRSTYRKFSSPDFCYFDLGFRLVFSK